MTALLFLRRYWKLIGLGLLAISITAIVWSHFASDARTDRALAKLTGEAGTVLFRLRDAADNPKLAWAETPGQIVALGESNKRLKSEIKAQTLAVDQWAQEAADRKADAEEWRQIAAKAEAQRKTALRKLGSMATTPGTREDLLQLIQEAIDASDLARENGA